MVKPSAQAFLSYAHADDEYLNGGITWLCQELQRAMRAITGEHFEVFQDVDGIAFGEHWPSRIEEALTEARFLIPILTPSYFTSEGCREEAEFFLRHEKRHKRRDLVLPIYLIEADVLEKSNERTSNYIARQFYARQYDDWRNTAFELLSTPRIKQRVHKLARQIKAAFEREAKDAPPIVPTQGPGIRFGLNSEGKVDRAPDEPSDVRDDNPRLSALQQGLQEACDNFLNAFQGDAGRNAFGPLIDRVEAYRKAIAGPLKEIQLTEVYRHGLALQNWVLAAKRDIDRLDPRPDLEDDQQAALSNLFGQHSPFILSTKEGEELQALADQDQTTAEERAKLWSPSLSEAAEVSDHTTERAKAVLRDVNQPSEDGTVSNRRALLAMTTNRNFLTATGEAATGKDFSEIGAEAMSEASRSASRFLLKNEKLINKLATSAELGLGWIRNLIGWLKTPAGQRPPPAPAIVTETFWTPGRVFRDVDEPWCPEMVVIPAGEFMMGSPEDEEGRRDNEGPQHLVTIEMPFALGRYPVTFEEFDFFCEQTGRESPDGAGWGRFPVISVSRDSAKAYCDWLREQASHTYRLPSEAEWEYACRAGKTGAYAFGETINKKQASFEFNVNKTSEVGAYPANAFKLFDMHGNVWEWCADHFQDGYEDAPSDGSPLLLSDGTVRMVRGGSWNGNVRDARSACRLALGPGLRYDILGFRCAGVQ